MQTQQRELQRLTLPGCAARLRSLLLTYMNSRIGQFTAMMTKRADATITMQKNETDGKFQYAMAEFYDLDGRIGK